MSAHFGASSKEPIAVLGMACRLPGAKSPNEFWELIKSGRREISKASDSRWRLSEALRDKSFLANASHAWYGGFLDDITGVDWRALRLHPREAKAMDPQHRLLLELAWEALEDAGYPVAQNEAHENHSTGVYIGIQWNDFFRLLCKDWQSLDGYSVVGNDLLFASNRISFSFNLPGPSQSIDCGCASGLVALQQGCNALWSGETEQALVGAVDLMVAPDSQLAMAATGMLSKTGNCRPLDANADGFVRGEGGVVLFLKPLSQVRPDERVHAVIRGVAAGHGGRSDWIMATPAATQADVIKSACKQADLAPGSLDYVELHGTGNLRGDPVEITALAETVGANRTAGPCGIGSIKAQIGHLGPVAGLAGMLKVILGLQHENLPQSCQPELENPALDLTACGLNAYSGGQSWVSDSSHTRRAGVTALSLGGVAAHVVLEEAAPSLSRDSTSSPETLILPISARTPDSLQDLAGAYIHALQQCTNKQQLTDLCYTAGRGRAHHDYRMVAVADNAVDFVADITRQIQRLQQTPATAIPRQQTLVSGWSLNETQIAQCEAAGFTVINADRLTGNESRLMVLAFEDEAEKTLMLNSTEEMFTLFTLRRSTTSLPLTFWAKAYLEGAAPDFAQLIPGGRMCSAPSYRWQRKKMWPQWLTPELIGTPPGIYSVANNSASSLVSRLDIAGNPGIQVWQGSSATMVKDGQLVIDEIVAVVSEQSGISRAEIEFSPKVNVANIAESTDIQIVLAPCGDTAITTLNIYQRDANNHWVPLNAEPHQLGEVEQQAALQCDKILNELASAPLAKDRRNILHRYVIHTLVRVLQPDCELSLLETAHLTDLGLDSISVSEIKALVAKDLSLEIPASDVFNAQTAPDLTHELVRRYEAERLLAGINTQAKETPITPSDDHEILTL